jgi:5-methylcytosine-specific restriction endonuclease McrA
LPDCDWSRLPELAMGGYSLRAIAGELGTTHTRVRKMANRMGILRPTKSAAIALALRRRPDDKRREQISKMTEARRESGRYHGERVSLLCACCGKSFLRMRNWVEQKTAFGSQIKNRYCSQECQRASARVARWARGRKRYNTIAQRKSAWSLHNSWALKVKKRDEYRCVFCSRAGVARDGTLVAHHILSWSECPDKRFDIENGITLCRDCHKYIHKIERQINEGDHVS